MTNTRAPMTFCAEPPGIADTALQWMWSTTRTMNTTVSTPVTIVMADCIRMMRSNPMTPPKMVRATTTISATTFVTLPPPQPRRSKTVAVASVARMTRMVSQPTVSSQEITDGSLLPLTPNAARPSTIVGAEPRLPATAMNPHSRNDTMMPTMLTTTACQNEIPNPSTKAP